MLIYDYMIEKPKYTIEKQDIKVPRLSAGESAIIFQRHGKYERDKTSERSGSITEDAIEDLTARDQAFFDELIANEPNPEDVMVLFVSSDTRYGQGYRSMETAQIAEDTAIEAFNAAGLNPTAQIINLNPAFKTNVFDKTGQAVRPDIRIHEPEFLDNKGYVQFLKDKYSDGIALTPKAWAMHEMDADKEVREELGAEGVYDIVDRTKRALAVMERYARVFHVNNPGKKLIIWAASHYDTLSPLAKDATDTDFGEYLPVDYGAGITIELKKGQAPTFEIAGERVSLSLATTAAKAIESKL